MLKWENRELYNYVNDIYNASRDNDLLKLRSLLDLITPNEERAIVQYDLLNKQHLFCSSFIKQLSFVFSFLCFYLFVCFRVCIVC